MRQKQGGISKRQGGIRHGIVVSVIVRVESLIRRVEAVIVGRKLSV